MTYRIPRATHHALIDYVSGDVAYNSTDPYNADQGIATGVTIGAMPKGAKPLFTHVHVSTAFNAGSTNVLTVGTSDDSGYDNLVAAAGVDETAVAGTLVANGVAALTAARDVFVKYAQTGTAATTGAATVTQAYIPKVY